MPLLGYQSPWLICGSISRAKIVTVTANLSVPAVET
jgi:hypothetical protein